MLCPAVVARTRKFHAEFVVPSVPAGSAHPQGVNTFGTSRLRAYSSHSVYHPTTASEFMLFTSSKVTFLLLKLYTQDVAWALSQK